MHYSSYSFGRCVVDKAMREVRLDGTAQPVAPKVFDLLVYLIEHRQRVVPKDELLDRVWVGAFLSDGVIARAVMKARRAIGDRLDEAQVIKTVHRVGYRFVATVTVAGPDRAQAPPSADRPPPLAVAPAHAGRLRLALLPFENRTGDADLVWVELGLVSVVNQALESDKRLAISAVGTVLKALDFASANDGFEQKAALLQRLIGAQWVCEGVIGIDEVGFSLDYRLIGLQAVEHRGVLQADEITALGRKLVKTVEVALFAQAASALALHSDDPVANQLFSRAEQAFEMGKLQTALRMIRVVIDISSPQTAARLAHLRVLGKLCDPEVLRAGEPLLREAIAAGDDRLASRIHIILADYLAHAEGDSPRMRRHAEEALRLATPYASGEVSEDWALQMHVSCANHAATFGETERARLLLETVAARSEKSSGELTHIRCAMHRAVLEAVDGNLVTARGIWNRVLKSSACTQEQPRALNVRNNLAEANLSLGKFEEAMAHCEEALKLLHSIEPQAYLVYNLRDLCVIHAEARQPASIEKVLEVGAPTLALARDGPQGNLLVMQAQRQAVHGDLQRASELLQQGIDCAIAAGHWFDVIQWAPMLLHCEMRAGRFEAAEAKAGALLALPRLRDSSDLVGLRCHAQALAAHGAGDVEHAAAFLEEAVQRIRPSRWYALARLDAAWLLIEAGQVSAARRALARAYAWPNEHPIGLVVSARLLFAQGRCREADDTQARALHMRPCLHAEQHSLGDVYRRATAGAAGPLPRVHRLPSIA